MAGYRIGGSVSLLAGGASYIENLHGTPRTGKGSVAEVRIHTQSEIKTDMMEGAIALEVMGAEKQNFFTDSLSLYLFI